MKRVWYVLFGYLLITILFFMPLLSSLNNQLIGPAEDNMQTVWNLWWGKKALFDANLDLTYTKYLFHPHGHTLLFHSMSWYNVMVSVPLQFIFSLPLVYNLLILSGFILAGLGAYLLCYYFTKNHWTSFIGGFIYAFNPSHYAHSLHHLNISTIQWIPFFVLFYLKAKKSGTWKNIGLASLFLVLNALSSWYYLVYLIIFVFLENLFSAIIEKKLRKSTIWLIAKISLISVVVLAPLIFPMIGAYNKNTSSAIASFDFDNIFVADLLGFVTPPFEHFIFGGSGMFEKFTGNPWEAVVYLGWIPLILTFILIRKYYSKLKIWVWLAGSFLVLSMGSYLHIGGKVIGIPLLYKIISTIPLLNVARVPSRSVVFVYLILAIFVAMQLKIWVKKYDWKFFAVGLLILLEFLSFATIATPYHMPEAFESLNEPMLIIPYNDFLANNRYMMYQTIHGVPMVNGKLSRVFDGNIMQEFDSAQTVAEFEKVLVKNAIKYVLVDKTVLVEASQTVNLLREIKQTKYEDEQYVLLG